MEQSPTVQSDTSITSRPAPRYTIKPPATSKLPTTPNVAERLVSVETALAEVMARLELTRPKFIDARPVVTVPVIAPAPLPKKTHAQRLAELVTTRGSVLVAAAQRELGLAQKDAYRLARAMAHRGEAVLVFEPFGHVDRLRLYRPDRVKLDP